MWPKATPLSNSTKREAACNRDANLLISTYGIKVRFSTKLLVGFFCLQFYARSLANYSHRRGRKEPQGALVRFPSERGLSPFASEQRGRSARNRRAPRRADTPADDGHGDAGVKRRRSCEAPERATARNPGALHFG